MAGTEPQREPNQDAEHVPPMTEEFDDAKHNLPSAGPVIIALVLVAVVLGAAALLLKQPPAATGSVGDIFAFEVPQQNSVLVTVPITIQNKTNKTLTIKNIYVVLHTPDQGDLSDNAAAASDFDRYFAAFPALKEHSDKPLQSETSIKPGTQVEGTVIVGYPVTKAKFDARKGITATVELYDYTDLKLNK